MVSTEEQSSVAFDTFIPNTLNVGPSVAFLITIIPLHCYILSGIQSAVIKFAGGFLVWSICWGALEYAMHKKDHSDRGSRHMAHHGNPSDRTLQDVDINNQERTVFWVYPDCVDLLRILGGYWELFRASELLHQL